MPVHLLLSIIAALLVYRDTKKWGYSSNTRLLWALGTAAAPYIVGLFYLILGRRLHGRGRVPRPVYPDEDVSRPEGEAVDVSETIGCPMCGSQVPSSFQQCPKCGYTMKLLCLNCGRELERDWKSCPYCGADAPKK